MLLLGTISVGVTLVVLVWIAYVTWSPAISLSDNQKSSLSQLISQLEFGLSAFVLFFLGLAVSGRQQLRSGSLVSTYDLMIMTLSLLLLTTILGAFASFGFVIASLAVLFDLSITLLFVQGLILSVTVVFIIRLAKP